MARSTPPINPHKVRFQLHNYLIKKLGTGTTADVFASIPRLNADDTLETFTAGDLTQKEACDEIRAALRAVKIINTRASRDGSLLKEKNHLVSLRAGRTHIVGVHDWDQDCNWISLDLLAGGTLSALEDTTKKEYRNRGTCRLPLSFGWHLIAEMATSMLELYFGIVGDELIPNSLQYTHGDLNSENMMLRYSGAYKDYPDIVIMDFGKCETLADDDDEDTAYFFFKKQADEVEYAATELEENILKGMTDRDPGLTEALQKMYMFTFEEDDVDNSNQRLSDILLEVRDEALQRRAETYSPLPVDMASNPLEKVVSDEKLLEVFPQLQAPVCEAAGDSPEDSVMSD